MEDRIYKTEDLDKLELQLSEDEEIMLKEIATLSQNMPKDKDLLSELVDASLKGTMDYVDSFIDITAIGDYQKNPESVKVNDEKEIKYASTASTNKEESERKYRTLKEARFTPYAKDALKDNSGMSIDGKNRLREYEMEYQNRIKTVDDHPHNYKTNEQNNFESLSGLDSYRFGPIIAAFSPEEYKNKYKQAGSPDNLGTWIRDVNFKHFDEKMANEFGFKPPSLFTKWRKANKLTIHEGPNGMYLVPSDVHNLERHSGQVSKLHQFLKGEITVDEYQKWEYKAKVERIKKEVEIRGKRALNGVKKSIFISIGKDLIVFLAQETKIEFQEHKNVSFIEHIKNIIKNWCFRIKSEAKNIGKRLGTNAISTISMEIVNAIIDFFLHSFKNIAKMIRAMLNSIIRALRIICDNNYSWEERLYEAIKILSAGMVAFLGSGLDEVIKDFITTTIPAISPAAPFIADAISGFISCILSSIVLCMFDRYKNKIIIRDANLRQDVLNVRLIYVNTSLALVSSIKAGEMIEKTVDVFGTSLKEIKATKEQIEKKQEKTKKAIEKRKEIADNTSIRISSMLEDDDENF